MANPTLTDAKLQTGTGWETTGSVGIGNGAATLSETAQTQTRLNQVFLVGPNDRYLTFTLADIGLDDIANGPDDAFEVGLLDANSGTSLTGTTGLTRNDAFVNLQANGTEFLGSNVTSTRNADGSRTYRLDLAGIPAGTAVNLSFDLIGFANAGSHVTVRDIRLGVPETRDDAVTTSEDTALDIDVRGNDLDADQPGYAPVVVTGPAHGSVTLSADGSFRYVPLADWNGEDSFTYKLSDGAVDSNLAAVRITVTAVNDAPVATDQTTTTVEDTVLTLDLLAGATDIDSTTFAAAIVTGPSHGSLTQNADGTFTYAPVANWNGEDSFSYRLNDGELDSAIATMRITVTAENDAPVVAPRTLEVDEDMPLIIDFLACASDVDGDALTVAITRPPMFGQLTQNADGTWTYTPNADFNGTETIEYEVNDGQTAVTGTLTVRVRPVNDAPVVSPIAATLLEDGSVTLDLLANAYDVDGDPLNVTVTQPTHGQVVQNADGSWTYTPDTDSTGEDAFTWTVGDGQASASGVVRLTITAVNDAPVAVADIATVAEDGSVTFRVTDNDFDVDGDALTMQIVGQPSHGTLVANADGSLTYTPAADWSGEDGFSYVVSDDRGESPWDGSFVSAIAPVRLIVAPVADAPTLAHGGSNGWSSTTRRTAMAVFRAGG